MTDIPEGFERHTRKSPLTDPWEPLYSKRTDKAVIIGLRLAKPHTNGRGLIHGGLIAALADNAMGHSCAHVMGGVSSLVTIGLTVDFVGTAEVGQWLAVESDVVKTGRTICFAQSLIKADGVVIARANACFLISVILLATRSSAQGITENFFTAKRSVLELSRPAVFQ